MGVSCRPQLLLLIAMLLLPPWRVAADAIVISRAMLASTIAEVFVEESSVRVELEIGLADLPAFRNLVPDAVYERLGYEPEPLSQRLPRFFREDFAIRADGGTPLAGRVVEIAPRPRMRRTPTSASRSTTSGCR
jgi:hypothetical protein